MRTLHGVARKPATAPTDADVAEFLQSVPDHRRRTDAIELIELMAEITGEPARMWGASIIGFGCYHYKYDSGHEGDSPIASFSPRKQHLVIYLVAGFEDRHRRLLDGLGKFKNGKGCLYIKRLDDIDMDVLRELIHRSARVRAGIDTRGQTAD